MRSEIAYHEHSNIVFYSHKGCFSKTTVIRKAIVTCDKHRNNNKYCINHKSRKQHNDFCFLCTQPIHSFLPFHSIEKSGIT